MVHCALGIPVSLLWYSRTINHALHSKQNGVVNIIYSSASTVQMSALFLAVLMLGVRMFY